MGRIPVFKTLEDAYGFAFGKFFSLLGISWFPFLLVGVLVYLLFRNMYAAFPTLALEDPAALLAIAPLVPVAVFIGFLLMCVILVGMTELALGKRQAPVYFYFSLGYPVWRLLIAIVCLYLLLFGLIVALSLATGAIAAAIGFAAGEGLGVAVAMLLSTALAFVAVYATVRLTFFIVPVTVAEGKNVITRAWALSKGNFWRIAGIVGGVVIPMIVLQMIAQGILMVPMMGAMSQMPLPPEGLSPEEGMAFVIEIMEAIAPFLLLFVPVIAAVYVLIYGLISGAAAFAYRTLSPEAEEAKAAAGAQ